MSVRNVFPQDGGEYPLGKETNDGDEDSSSEHSIETRSRKSHSFDEPPKWPEDHTKKRELFNLPEPDEEQGMGDILYGLLPDPNADPVEEIDEYRR